MMGQQTSERELFSYAIKLEKRVRSNLLLIESMPTHDFEHEKEEEEKDTAILPLTRER